MKIWLSTMVLLILALTSVTPILAQTPDSRCISLTEEDCAIFIAAVETMQGIGSFNNQAFSLTLGGAGGTSEGNTASATGTGPMLVDETGAIIGFDLQTQDAAGQSGQLIWFENMLYLGSPAEEGELTWAAISTETELGGVAAQLISGNLFITALNQPNVAVTQRGEDTELNGQSMIAFESSVDLIAFLLTPDVLSLLETLLQSLPQDAMGGTEGEANPLDQFGGDLAGAIPLLSLLLTQDTVQAVIWVGAEDGLVHHVEFMMDIVLDPSAIDPTQQPISFQFGVVTDLDQHGAEVTITPPADYEEVDVTALDLNGLSGDILGGVMGGGADSTAPAATAIPDNELYAVEETIPYGETVSGTLTGANPQDVWGFEAQAGDIITITLRATNADSVLDTQLELRDPNGVELTSNDDHATERTELIPFDSVIENFEIPADGEYRLVATWLAEVTDGAYELTLEKAN